ncbi:SCO6745 family protein [Amycolatopsis suaedae]|uniref:SalK n=1 Tax=Amycolatopsis suaedae TaxID=2510978 RepID=A0A4Q7J6R4_9PSEU|nr:hypothetical protein [Amycolatopsis suaedae]RZQ62588.1 hypothetical protein EWH70_16575 [Amycolatopsis suaedae]
MDAQVVYRCHRVLEPIHAMSYFAPEVTDGLVAAGLRPGRMGYFASRSAPFGPVGPEVVAATFYNFNPELIARMIPEAWTLAEPARILEARFEGAGKALRRLLGDELAASDALAEAAALVREAAEGCDVEGRSLYAAHAGLDWPDDPLLVLWHGATLMREHRGDGHIGALVAFGLSGIEALVSHTATGKGFVAPAAQKSRGWSDEQWAAATESLRADGVLDADGELTEQGNALRQRIEDATNVAAARPWRRLGADKAARLLEVTRPLAKAVVGNGAFPDGVFAARSEKRGE